MVATSKYIQDFFHPVTGEWVELRLRPIQIAIDTVRYYTIRHGSWTVTTLGHSSLTDALEWCKKETTIKEKVSND